MIRCMKQIVEVDFKPPGRSQVRQAAALQVRWNEVMNLPFFLLILVSWVTAPVYSFSSRAVYISSAKATGASTYTSMYFRTQPVELSFSAGLAWPFFDINVRRGSGSTHRQVESPLLPQTKQRPEDSRCR